MSELLVANDLRVAYREGLTVREVSLAVRAGEILGVVGPSGAGKSILVRALLDLVPAPGRITHGTIHVFGQDLRTLTAEAARQVRGARIGVVVQNPRAHLNPLLRVGHQIVQVYRAHHDVSRAVARERAISVLRDVGISAPERRYEAYPHELSGGMAQRVMIAMALVCDPSLLIADEPTSGLDVTIQEQILQLIRHSVEKRGAGGLCITRDMGIVARFCDRVAVMHEGRIIETAAIPEFFEKAEHPVSLQLIAAASFAPELAASAEPVQELA